ncbi:family 78 glycoside hydrolase catalytic domain [Alteromonas aestuariivivens]|nr:family 78 glycoside hydrolase catalytic domain [Alteromonas aestuariivivens]
MRLSLVLLFTGMLVACGAQIQESASAAQPDNLLTEGLKSPFNVHHSRPALSWHANVKKQSAYQIQVASSESVLQSGAPDYWDSGKVSSGRSVNILYQGQPLAARAPVYWRVKVWSEELPSGSGWSNTGYWEMGLVNKTDWQAKWVQVANPEVVNEGDGVEEWMTFAADLNNPMHRPDKVETQKRVITQLKEEATAGLFRHDFTTETSKKLVSARLHSTAAGYYEVFINGEKVDDRIMDPGQTDFDKRILYNTDDVLGLLASGQNTIAVHLGSGWYHEFIAFSKPERNYYLGYGQPAFIAQLELTYDDGSQQLVVSDQNWLSHASPVLKEGIFSGELYDANRAVAKWNEQGADVSDWQPVAVLNEWPTEVLEPQLLPAIKAIKEVKPVVITSPEANVWVYDFGQNFTGIPTVDISSLGLSKGQAVHFRYGEWMDAEGYMSQKSGGGAPLLSQVDTYIASGDDQGSWTPTFTWHGFRYLEVRGLDEQPPLDAITAHLVRSSVERAGSFESSDPMLNRIHEMALWSYEGNLMSLPMDCPIRERAGWTGDAHAALITGNYNFNMENLWQKYVRDFETSAYVAPAVVPGKRSHGGNYDWAAAEVIIAWEHYRHHGDIRLLQDQYESMLEYMKAGENVMENDLIRIGYGDWCDPVRVPGTPRVNGRCSPQHTVPTITSSAFFAHSADLMAKISTLLGKTEQAAHFFALFDNISDQFNQEFYNPQTGHYGSQTADALALRFGIAPEPLRQKVADALKDNVENDWNGHGAVGALGQTYLYRALSDNGYGDTAFNIFKAKGYPGYDYLFNELKATTLWERKGFFDPYADPTGKSGPGFSLNHPFHSGYDGWFYEGLGGIRPLADEPGFQRFELSPVFPGDLEYSNVSYTTGYGTIVSKWKRVDGGVEWTFEIPDNTTALVTVPGGEQSEYLPGKYSLQLSM